MNTDTKITEDTTNYQQLVPTLLKMGVLTSHDIIEDEFFQYFPAPNTTVFLTITSPTRQVIHLPILCIFHKQIDHENNQEFTTTDLEIFPKNSTETTKPIKIEPYDIIHIKASLTQPKPITTYSVLPARKLVLALCDCGMVWPDQLTVNDPTADTKFTPINHTIEICSNIYHNNELIEHNVPVKIKYFTITTTGEVMVDTVNDHLEFLGSDLIQINAHRTIPTDRLQYQLDSTLRIPWR